MTDAPDATLLEQFAKSESEEAFAEIVRRHIALVHSVAARGTYNSQHAQEITQAVFIILARKAASLSREIVLSGWLYHTARLTAANFQRAEFRRMRREQEVFMQSASLTPAPDIEPAWRELSPLLEDGMARLGSKERDAIVLRFFENKSLQEVGRAMGLEERAAQKRVARGLEKLRAFFGKRGVVLSAAIIAGAVSANSVQAAPAGITVATTTIAAKGAMISATTAALVKGTMKTMMWLKLKFAAGFGVIALVAGGVATVAISQTSSADSPSVPEIVKHSQDAYAALSSYSDEGKTVSSIGSTIVAPHTFTIKLARPDLYRIEWKQDVGFYAQTGIVWSAGNGNFTIMGAIKGQRTNSNMETTLSGATGVSGGAAGSIPGTFFKMNWGNVLGATMQSATRQPDEKIGDVDCYVLAQEKNGRIRTLWIGKEDFLIRQIENETSAADLKAMLETEAKKHPEMKLPTSVAGDSKSIETHTNIVVNQQLSPADFEP